MFPIFFVMAVVICSGSGISMSDTARETVSAAWAPSSIICSSSSPYSCTCKCGISAIMMVMV